MSKINDLTGQVFGRLTVRERDGQNKKGNAVWKCVCSCGKTKSIVGYSLSQGHVVSCGCFRSEALLRGGIKLVSINTTHGMTQTKTYKSWQSMKDRCSNPNNVGFHRYGGRGISYCKRWGNLKISCKIWGGGLKIQPWNERIIMAITGR